MKKQKKIEHTKIEQKCFVIHQTVHYTPFKIDRKSSRKC